MLSLKCLQSDCEFKTKIILYTTEWPNEKYGQNPEKGEISVVKNEVAMTLGNKQMWQK